MSNRERVIVGLAGAGIGVALVLVIAGGVWVVHDVLGPHEPGTVSSTCADASFDVTVGTGPGESSDLVTAQVVIYDPQARDWQVLWRGYSEPVVDVRVEDSLPVGQAFAVLTDLDNGTDRSVWVRPADQNSWCKVTAGLG